MSWSLVIGAAVKIVTWWLSSKDRERATLAVREINRIAEASDDEIAKARAAHDDARNDPDVGRM